MSLALHQLRHELRRSRVFVTVYLIILFGHFAVAMGWIGQPEYSGQHDGWGNAPVLPGFIAMAFWIALTLLVMGVVTADSPSNRDRLLATRPFSTRPLITAKALFILLALVLPAMVLEIIALHTIDAPGPIVAIGAIEHGAVLAIYCAFVALFSAHWSSAFTAKLAFAITVGLAAAFIGSVATLLDFITSLKGIERIQIPEATLLTAALSTVVICLGLAITLRLATRHQWKTRRLILPFAGLTVLWFALAIWIPIHSFTLPGSEQNAVEQIFDAKSGELAFTPEPIDNGTVRVGYALTPEAPAHPDDWEVRWGAQRTAWIHDGDQIPRDRPRRRWTNGTVIGPGNTAISPALMKALRRHVPDFRFLLSDRSHETSTRRSLEIGELHYPHNAPPRGTMEVRSEITATAARWNLAADLPFETKIPVESGPWRLCGRSPENAMRLAAYVSLRTPRLQTVTDRSMPATAHRWTKNVAFAVHIPDRELVWIAGSHVTQWVPGFSSAAQVFAELRFDSHYSHDLRFTAEEIRSARLLIFQAEHLGGVTREFRSPPFTLRSRPGEKSRALAAVQRPHTPESSPAAFSQWLSKHQELPVDLPADQLREHLDDLFNRARRSGAYLEYPQSPVVNHLARFVPHHRDLLLDSIRGMSSETAASRLVLKALTQGAARDDKTAIIDALVETPILIETIIERDWTVDARDEIVILLQSHPKDLDVLRALISFDDPRYDDLLLDSFRTSRSVQAYQSLRPIPRLRDRLDAATRELWSPELVVIHDDPIDPHLELALHQGRLDALAHFLGLLPDLSYRASSVWRTADIAERVFLLPKSLRPHRHDSDKVLRWLRSQRAEDFRFDPVLQRFVLVDPNSI